MNDRVQCLCGEPYLRTIEGKTTRYYLYRLASAGPESQPVIKCEKCGRVLDIGTTKEIPNEL